MPAKTPPPSIHWYEGMFLQPHHFQQLSRQLDDTLDWRARLLSPQGWGVVRIAIDEESLAGGRLVIPELEAILPDGLVVTTALVDRPLELDISDEQERLEDGATLRIGLAVAEAEAGPKTVDTGDEDAVSYPLRFASAPGDRVVDATSGANETEVARLKIKARLVRDDDDTTGHVVLPLLDVAYWGGAMRVADYIPPTVLIQRETPLAEMLRKLFVAIREKAARIATDHESAQAHKNDLRMLETRFQGLGLTSSLPVFEQMLQLESFRPVDFYLALCRYVAELGSLTGIEIVPGPMPAYDHLDLHTTFAALIARIRELLGPSESPYEKVEVRGKDGMFEVLDLRPEHVGRETYFVVWAGVNAHPEGLIRWVERDCVIGNGDQIRDLVRHVVLGIERHLMEPRPIDLQVQKGSQVFQLRPNRDYLDALRQNQQLFFMRARKDVQDATVPTVLEVYVKKER